MQTPIHRAGIATFAVLAALCVCSESFAQVNQPPTSPTSPSTSPNGDATEVNPSVPGSSMPSSSTASSKFSKLDKNHDGFIDKKEAKADRKLSKQFDSLDKDHDGKLDPAEFPDFEADTGKPASSDKSGY